MKKTATLLRKLNSGGRWPLTAASALAALAMLVVFQNCGKFAANRDARTTSLRFGTFGGDDLQPLTDKLDPSCMTNSNYDTCIFRKNPVAQRGGSFSSTSITSSDIAPYQHYGVKLTGLAPSGYLENGAFSVMTLNGPRLETFSTNFKFDITTDKANAVAQLMTYYWLNRTAEYIDSRTGVLYVRDKGVKVYVDDSISGWSGAGNSIHLQINDAGGVMAYNADIAIHLFGQANAHHASQGAIHQADDAKHVTCGPYVKGCCSSDKGCAKAIASGVGDYFVAMMFPDSPAVGETWANSPTGLALCNFPRDPKALAARTPNEGYIACGSDGGQGDASTMGAIYASIWWNVRDNAEILQPGASKDIDTLFMEHLALLTGADDFITVQDKIKSVDERIFSGRYHSFFTKEFQRRGL